MPEQNSNLQGEVRILESWAEDVQRRLGEDKFEYELIRTHIHEEDLLTVCVFSVKCEEPSREVKRVIREEADKYRQGRLYFMGYNDIQKIMFLQFYSFYMGKKEEAPRRSD